MNTMEMTWSLGKTIFDYPVPEDRAIDKDPADMTLDELIATQDRELPTISRSSWALTGAGTWSLDRAKTDDEGGTHQTIADRLPDDHDLKTGWQTAIPLSEMTPEMYRAYDTWCAEHTRGTRMTPYRTIHPLTTWRIAQERDSVRTGPVVSYRITRNVKGEEIVAIRGRKLTDAEFQLEAKRYLRLLRDRHGHVPSLDEIESDYSDTKELWDAVKRGEVGFRKFDYTVDYLMAEDTDPYREDFFDEIAHSSYEAYEEPFIDDTYVTGQGLDPGDVEDNMPRTLILHFRSKRDRIRYQVNKENNDAFWHTRIGEPNEMGTDDGFRSKGRKVTLNTIADRVIDLAQSSINALSILRD